MVNEESIRWDCGNPTPAHRRAVENFMESLAPWEQQDLDCIVVHPGMVEGLTKGLYPIARRLYDADTGEIFPYKIETLLHLPEMTELHLSEPEDDGLQW